jgi:hypothetical protein
VVLNSTETDREIAPLARSRKHPVVNPTRLQVVVGFGAFSAS